MKGRREFEYDRNFSSIFFFCFIFCILICTALYSIYNFVPSIDEPEIPSVYTLKIEEKAEDEDLLISQYITETSTESSLQPFDKSSDKGLSLYRHSVSKDSVKAFYNNVTKNKEVTNAILTYADKNDIPLSLAFALAYTESRFKTRAVGHNTNGTTDRGLFQLNSSSFPQLSEEDFFDPYTSAKYGLAHLKYCIRSGGNYISALAMYNAGQGRVSSNKTPQMTLNYIGNIINYQISLEQQFTDEVVIYYESQLIPLKDDL